MVSIVRFAGTNCEFDMHYIYEKLLRIPSAIIWHKDTSLPKDTKLVILAGGFSYGDYLRSGAIARFAPIMKAIKAFGENGGRILGICNGFQILTEAKLLPGALMRNHNLHFISKTTPLRIANTDNAFLRPHKQDDLIALPIAHADGRYHIDEDSLGQMQESGQILLRYVDNLNGSVDSIAGICNKDKNIFGLMPHPERACEKMLYKRARYADIRHSYSTQITPKPTQNAQGIAMLESIYKG